MQEFRRQNLTLSSTDERYFYPNRMGRIVLIAMEDIMGRHAVNAVLNLAGMPHRVDNFPSNNLRKEYPFSELSALQSAMDEIFGVRAGQALARRTGRETFKYALQDFMPIMGIADLTFRPLHLGIKLKIGLEVFAETFNKFTDQIVRLEEEADKHRWIIERCPVCWKRETNAPCCHLAVGLLEESLSWVSNGRIFRVEEVSCIAAGDISCIINIYKQSTGKL